jgi:hypothetical protein
MQTILITDTIGSNIAKFEMEATRKLEMHVKERYTIWLNEEKETVGEDTDQGMKDRRHAVDNRPTKADNSQRFRQQMTLLSGRPTGKKCKLNDKEFNFLIFSS